MGAGLEPRSVSGYCFVGSENTRLKRMAHTPCIHYPRTTHYVILGAAQEPGCSPMGGPDEAPSAGAGRGRVVRASSDHAPELWRGRTAALTSWRARG
jgi:hypothetical protein